MKKWRTIFFMNTFGIKLIIALLAGLFFSSAAEAEVNWAKRYFEMAVEHHLTGNNEEAIDAFKESLRYNNKDATTHYYLSLVYDRKQMGAAAIKHMLKAEEFFEVEGRDYWKDRARKKVEEYYHLYKYSREEFEE